MPLDRPFFIRQGSQRFQGLAFRVYAYHMVVRFMAGGQCGTSGSGVGDEAVGAIGFREAGVLGVVQPELAPGWRSKRNTCA